METGYLDFDEYIRQGEPGEKEKAAIWRTAIGLQAVDGLQTSEYLKDIACKHIEGKIGIDEVRELIKTYYQSKTHRESDSDEKQEADKVSANITKILSTDALDFSAKGYIALHRRIFEGVFKHAGSVRDYDITKKEWVLNYDTVHYLNWEDLYRALEHDIDRERSFSYKGISSDALITHISGFVSGIWQIHPFREGNTRTTAVFAILYLRSIGFKVKNDMFAEHSWYFRNALVRANFRSAVLDIDYSPEYLERFFRNLLLGEQWDLRNRYLHIHPTKEWAVQPNMMEPASMDNTPEQVPEQVSNLLYTSNASIINLVRIIGVGEYSISQLMEVLVLKHRPNFLEYHLNPAIKEGYICMRYPDKPRHPKQKYLLTPKGLALYNELNKDK